MQLHMPLMVEVPPFLDPRAVQALFNSPAFQQELQRDVEESIDRNIQRQYPAQ